MRIRNCVQIPIGAKTATKIIEPIKDAKFLRSEFFKTWFPAHVVTDFAQMTAVRRVRTPAQVAPSASSNSPRVKKNHAGTRKRSNEKIPPIPSADAATRAKASLGEGAMKGESRRGSRVLSIVENNSGRISHPRKTKGPMSMMNSGGIDSCKARTPTYRAPTIAKPYRSAMSDRSSTTTCLHITFHMMRSFKRINWPTMTALRSCASRPPTEQNARPGTCRPPLLQSFQKPKPVRD